MKSDISNRKDFSWQSEVVPGLKKEMLLSDITGLACPHTFMFLNTGLPEW